MEVDLVHMVPLELQEPLDLELQDSHTLQAVMANQELPMDKQELMVHKDQAQLAHHINRNQEPQVLDQAQLQDLHILSKLKSIEIGIDLSL